MDREKDYFVAYEDLEVHSLMLRDKPRVDAYSQALKRALLYYPQAVVLDVGAGTGLLSCIAAKAGAKHVYAVEASTMALLCAAVVQRNALSSRISVMRSGVEQISLPTKVDVIVSEW
eukprot:CAMPEP_0183788998 /NCGR_PEP_ID=MMETSP0803_2-20130417/142_1 /TAXON_ID=195967 /ORGANISM="Crustomastix stigmata, Strain CCMP3273" /LENGTH=116 /DNA_ID=CAMNT_0026033151 /DNA_START=175 /DNA_END=522 /DNA_ORIENTATION=-